MSVFICYNNKYYSLAENKVYYNSEWVELSGDDKIQINGVWYPLVAGIVEDSSSSNGDSSTSNGDSSSSGSSSSSSSSSSSGGGGIDPNPSDSSSSTSSSSSSSSSGGGGIDPNPSDSSSSTPGNSSSSSSGGGGGGDPNPSDSSGVSSDGTYVLVYCHGPYEEGYYTYDPDGIHKETSAGWERTDDRVDYVIPSSGKEKMTDGYYTYTLHEDEIGYPYAKLGGLYSAII